MLLVGQHLLHYAFPCFILQVWRNLFLRPREYQKDKDLRRYVQFAAWANSQAQNSLYPAAEQLRLSSLRTQHAPRFILALIDHEMGFIWISETGILLARNPPVGGMAAILTWWAVHM